MSTCHKSAPADVVSCALPSGAAVQKSGLGREEVFVTTKLWNSDHGYRKALQAFERSLQKLGLEYGEWLTSSIP
jgi:diketogulonate reductase-like aldo/keto reductase